MVNALTSVTDGAARRPAVLFTPRADILETPEEMLLFLDLPGVKAEDLEVHFESGELLVHGRVKPVDRGSRWMRSEYELGDFRRVFLVGQEIDAERITAELRDGVLKLHLPKADAARPRRISVKGT